MQKTGKLLNMNKGIQSLQNGLHKLLIRYGMLLFLLGFLLGRAVMVGEMSPFAIAFVAVLFHLRRDKLWLVGVAVFAGALSHEAGTPFVIALGIIFFLLIQNVLIRWERSELSYVPGAVFFSVLLAKLVMAFFDAWNTYALLMGLLEASLSMVLTLIFIHSLPLVTGGIRKQVLKNEEIVCLVILLASVLTGTVGWLWLGLSLEQVLARYAILVFALAAGGAIGATVGVVMGIILSLAQIEAMLSMSLLAFCGLLGGLMKEGGKIGVAAGLIVGTLLMGFYVQGNQFLLTFQESMLAIALFFMTPKSWISHISQYIPGTTEHASLQHNYTRRLRNMTAQKVNQFSDLFERLGTSFADKNNSQEEDKKRQKDLLLSEVTENSCQICFKKEKCWKQQDKQTYEWMTSLIEHLDHNGTINHNVMSRWKKYCVKSNKVLDLMAEEMNHFHIYLDYRKKLDQSKQLVADQLKGVSQVMTNFAQEIKKESEGFQVQEQEVLDALDELGLSIRSIDILSLAEGNVQIDVLQPPTHQLDECRKLIAPLLSDMIGETIQVAETDIQQLESGYTRVRLQSAKTFKIQSGFSGVAKGGGILSGDSSNMMEVGYGKYALAIADGMGNGERAHKESKETLSLLQQILQSGIEETVAIKSINSVLSLRSTDEVYSTLDLAMIDLRTANTKFLKIGSTPSFIKRGQDCLSISAQNIPIGILNDIEVDVVEEQLKAGDLLIMMTDGIYDAPRDVEDKESWIMNMIKNLETEEPQQVADLLLENVIRYHEGLILDDMTVVVAKVERNIPQWSPISLAHIPKWREKGKVPSALES